MGPMHRPASHPQRPSRAVGRLAACVAGTLVVALALGSSLSHEHTAASGLSGSAITSAGQPAELTVAGAGESAVRILLRPLALGDALAANPALASRANSAPAIAVRELAAPVRRRVGRLTVEARPDPLRVTVTNERGQLVQEVAFEHDGRITIALDSQPVLGLGEGGPRPTPDRPWREQPVQFDRRGALDTMEPRWQADMYGSRNPAPMLLGTRGLGRCSWRRRGCRWTCGTPTAGSSCRGGPTRRPPRHRTSATSRRALGKGLPPPGAVVPGLLRPLRLRRPRSRPPRSATSRP